MLSPSRVACILLSVVFFALVVLPIVEAACPHNCSNNGRCSHNTCTCNAGYAGSDCSIRIVPIQSGEVVEDGLNTFTWKYYSIVVPPGTAALNVTTEQTNQLGDVDTYIARGTLPTFSEYMVKDISTKRFYVLSIPNPPPGTYYIGQYAYFHVEYSMHADIIVDCSLDCGEHGSCVGNTCQCNTNWSGDTCTIYDELLYSGQIVYNTVADQQWLYYHISVGNKQTLAIHVEQPTASTPALCDVDVYVNKNEFPTMFDFDYANATVNPITELSIRDPGAGVWYIGIYGYHGCQFSIVVTVSDMVGCIGECSRHGSCSGNTCYCTTGFNGDTCQEKLNSIQYGVSESGFVGYQTWNYYHLDTSTSNNIVIAVSQESSSADCDLFVRRDSKPSNFEFDYSDLSSRQYFNVTIVDPGTATWWIGVYGWTDCAYSLVANIPTSCACGESSHGRCPAGSSQCICDFGWSGVGCDQQENLMTNGEVYDDSVTLNHWTYYRIAANASAMLISMKEVNTVGRLWLFASLNGFPALDAYEKADISTKNNFHEVHFVFPHPTQNVYYIGVYGSPFSPTDTEMDYRITAWAPPF